VRAERWAAVEEGAGTVADGRLEPRQTELAREAAPVAEDERGAADDRRRQAPRRASRQERRLGRAAERHALGRRRGRELLGLRARAARLGPAAAVAAERVERHDRDEHGRGRHEQPVAPPAAHDRKTTDVTPDELEAVARRKDAVRERVWTLLERERAARFPGARGRIPNFVGAERAAARLAELPEWREAHVIKANPDAPQLPVRRRALADGKVVYMAVPRLRDEKPFLRLGQDATIKARDARPVALDEMEPLDLVVCGTVAVSRDGVRVGKGGGYSDLELGLLVESGLVGDGTTLVTTVHPLQVLDEELPETEHDFRVDLIVTLDETIAPPRHPRPPGILWEHLSDEKIGAVPVLRGRR
jgi:5-formyltetrahydrofolate cyclo-ligase